jgi:hypothetical protein
MAYVPNTFTIEAEADWKELLDWLVASGIAKKCEVPMFDEPAKPLTPILEPTCLKFYQNWKHSDVKNRTT